MCGGASGLGAATARRLRAERRAGDDRRRRRRARRGARGRARRGASRACDVTDPAAGRGRGRRRRRRACGSRSRARGSAGRRRPPAGAAPHAVEPFHRVIAVNLLGSFHLLRAAAAAMLGRARRSGDEAGVIVMTASIAAYDGQIGQLAYCRLEGRRRRHDAAGGARPRERAASASARSRRGCSTRRCSPGCPRRRAPRSARRSRIPRASARPRSTPRSPRTSSRTRCSTARSSGSTARSACRRGDATRTRRSASMPLSRRPVADLSRAI